MPTEDADHDSVMLPKPDAQRAPPLPLRKPSPVDALLTVKVTEAIKADDIPALSRILQEANVTVESFRSPFGSLLHLASMYGTVQLCAHLIHAHPGLDVNLPNLNDGQTALHIASKLGRQELVELLLSLESVIDDTVKDRNGRLPCDLGKTRSISSLFEYAKNLHVIRTTKQMHACAHRGDTQGLQALFDIPRNQALLDINARGGGASGDTCLHLGARHGFVNVVRLCLNLGADPFLKNKRGKIAYEVAKDEFIRILLREAPMVSNSNGTTGNQRCEGFLSKWTNYAEGYRRRWFVLEDGVLSYYKSQVDYPVTCKGSLNLQFATIASHPSDKLRFEVLGLNSRMRYHLRADNAADAKRWIISISQAQQALSHRASPSQSSSSIPIVGPGSFGLDDQDPEDDNYYAPSSFTLMREDPFVGEGEEMLREMAAKVALVEMLPTEDPGCQVAKALHDLFDRWRQREEGWRAKLQAEVQQRQLFEDSLRTVALQNHKLELWTRRNMRCDSLVDQASSLQSTVGTEEFFDAIQSDLEDDDYDDDDYADEHEEADESGIEGDMEQLRLKDQIRGDDQGNSEQLTFGYAQELGYPAKARAKLPADRSAMPPVNLWSIVRGMLGKDLFRIALPVNFSEPLSMLQRLCEEMEYSSLLDRAAQAATLEERLTLVAAFAVSGYASTDHRLNKPFNPLLGETFEYAHANWRYVSEQVSHHPPVSAAHCENSHWVYESEAIVRNKFTGKSLDLIPDGCTSVRLKSTRETFQWRKVKTSIYNLIVGKLWLDHHGTMTITAFGREGGMLGEIAVEFVPANWLSSTTKQVRARIGDRVVLSGQWNGALLQNGQGGGEVWRKTASHAPHALYYMTPFAMDLNCLSDGLAPRLPPTDSRWRPDQRAMEEGRFPEASELKTDLEHKQRAANGSVGPCWFQFDQERRRWRFLHEYWECRGRGDWSRCPRIFDLQQHL